MKCEFSETQFAFCYVFELLAKYPARFVMPWFLNTVQEGRYGGGPDVRIEDIKINGSLFLQFKIPVYLKTKQKFKINIDTNQRQKTKNGTKPTQFYLLKQLIRPANLVYYCAPKFHEEEKIRKLYNDNQIEENSVLFPVEEFPNDGSYHRLEYEYKSGDKKAGEKIPNVDIDNTKQNTFGLLSSDPMKISIFKNIFSGSFNPYPMSLRDKAKYVLNDIISKVEPIPEHLRVNNEVNLLFLMLLLDYNILWVPIIK